MKDIITKIISKMSTVYNKICRIDRYWYDTATFTDQTTISNVLTGYTVTIADSVGVGFRGNLFIVGLTVTRTGSAISTGTYIANKLCDLTISGIEDYIPAGTSGGRGVSVLAPTGPMINCEIGVGSRVDSDTITKPVYLGQVVGGSLAQNTACTLRLYCQIPRLVP